MAGSIENAYLSGWEYNRLLQADPMQARISALPAASLWLGAHQFWMFKQVLCTKESIDSELAAADALGWATGAIFEELKTEGIVRSVDWTDLPAPVSRQLTDAHRRLREEFPEDLIRRLIDTRQEAQLEEIKNRLLSPILEHFGATASGAPESLGIWPGTEPVESQRLPIGPAGGIASPLSRLARPILPGVSACAPPGTGLDPGLLATQRRVQETVEAPLISMLTAGDGEFAGARGFAPYFEVLRPHEGTYQRIDQKIWTDWRESRERLLRLRDAAETHLWRPLHHEWLPALESGQMRTHEFERLIDRAVHIAPLVRFFDSQPVQMLIGAISIGATRLMPLGGAVLSQEVTGDPITGTALGIGAAAIVESAGRRLRLGTENLPGPARLAVFYQAASQASS